MSVRGAVAQQQGADEEMLAKVDMYEASDLSDYQKAALKVADTYLMSPSTLTEDTKAEIAKHLSGPEILELVLHLMQYSSDKIMVALGLDLEEIRIMTFDSKAIAKAVEREDAPATS